MHHLAGKLLVALAIAMLASFAGACGEEPSEVIPVDDEDCADGYYWDDDAGECVPEEVPGSCETDDDCMVSGQECRDGTCQYVAHQCASVGDECEPGETTAEGFECADLGRGYQCYETCREARACDANGNPTTEAFCNRNQTCVRVDDPANPQGNPLVCQPSECEGYFDTDEGCAELRQQDSEAVKNGEHCVEVSSGTFVCEGAGEQQAGDTCSETSDCAEGLTCVNELAQQGGQIATMVDSLGTDSFCAPACDGDDMCDDGQECIGDDDGAYDGVGFCGDRCEPFGTDEDRCDENTACVPVSGEDGVCFRETTRELDYYEPCDSTEQCPDSAECWGDLLTGDGDRCLPLCDPRASDPDATCPQPDGEDRVLGGDCFDLSMAVTGGLPSGVGSGICFEACEDSNDWGRDACTAEDAGCRPETTDAGWCVGVGEGERGDECEGDDECGDGLHCDLTGEGVGVCRSYCQPEGGDNENLECEDYERCIEMEGDYENLGTCRVPCDPGTNHTDPNCPEGQQTCMGTGDQAYCAPSGDLAHGEECGNPEEQNCAPGLVCAQTGTDLNGVLIDPFSDTDDGTTGPGGPVGPGSEEATCRQLCEPFVGEFGDSGCPEGYACSMVTPDGQSRTQGHCVPAFDTERPAMEECPADDAGTMCDDNSFCIPPGAGGNQCVEDDSHMCVQFCDYTTGTGCTGNTECSEGFQGGALFGWLGLCL